MKFARGNCPLDFQRLDRPRAEILMHALVLLFAICAAYFNSFRGVFLFDDYHHIVENPAIRHLWPITEVLKGTERPLVQFLFAINFALSGLQPWSYHAINLGIHLSSAFLLMKIIQRTLNSSDLKEKYAEDSSWLALGVALLWGLHPIQTQSVTYIVQRAECLMGFFFLLSIYAVIRSANNPSRLWPGIAILSCVLGMATKSVMITAPAFIFFYDSVFLAGSATEALKKRKWIYAGLAASWLVLVILFAPLVHRQNMTAGFSIQGMSPWRYGLNELAVIAHYIRLALWPDKLVFDYAWMPRRPISQFLIPGLFLLTLVLMNWELWCRNRKLGFLGFTFFLLLLPTSSLFPLSDLAAEHRLYLPLIVPSVFLVLGSYETIQRFLPFSKILKRGIFILILFFLALLLGFLTAKRNADYWSQITMWQDVIRKRPANARAHFGLGSSFFKQGKYDEAIEEYQEALRIKPDYVKALNDLSLALLQKGNAAEAKDLARHSVEIMPDFPEGYNSLGLALAQQGKWSEAIESYRKAIRILPHYAEAHNHLGMALAQLGKFPEAAEEYQNAIQIKPYYAGAYNNLGNVLMQQGKFSQAIEYYQKAIHLDPDLKEAIKNLDTARAAQKISVK